MGETLPLHAADLLNNEQSTSGFEFHPHVMGDFRRKILAKLTHDDAQAAMLWLTLLAGTGASSTLSWDGFESLHRDFLTSPIPPLVRAHSQRKVYMAASPRIFKRSQACTTIPRRWRKSGRVFHPGMPFRPGAGRGYNTVCIIIQKPVLILTHLRSGERDTYKYAKQGWGTFFFWP